MNTRKLLWIFASLLVVMSMTLSACGGGAATEAPEAPPEPAGTALAVGVVLPTREEPRWIQDETRFNDAFSKAGYDVEILFSEGDSAKEKVNVENLITKGVKVIIICPQDGAAAAAAAEEARAAGVKVIAYDRLILNTDAVDYYVTFDSVAVGEAQGQYLVDHASGTGNPLYLYAGAASDNNAFLFFEGAWNALQPKIADGTFYVVNSSEAVGLQDKAKLLRDEMGRIIGQVTTEWDFDTAKTLAESNLTAASAADKGDVFILAPNDGTARAIADAFASDADVSSYVVTGQDAEEASVQYIIDGKQSMTVLKDVRTLVADAISAAVAYLEGSTPPETNSYNNGAIDVPAAPSEVVTVDQSNVKEAIIDSGYWPASDFTGLDKMGEDFRCNEDGDNMVCVFGNEDVVVTIPRQFSYGEAFLYAVNLPIGNWEELKSGNDQFTPYRVVINFELVLDPENLEEYVDTFDPSIELRVRYTESDIERVGEIENLQLGFWDGTKWVSFKNGNYEYDIVDGYFWVKIPNWGDRYIGFE